MQVGMYQLIEFHTSGANSAGILFTTVFTADVTGISYCQGNFPVPSGPQISCA